MLCLLHIVLHILRVAMYFMHVRDVFLIEKAWHLERGRPVTIYGKVYKRNIRLPLFLVMASACALTELQWRPGRLFSQTLIDGLGTRLQCCMSQNSMSILKTVLGKADYCIKFIRRMDNSHLVSIYINSAF